MMYKWLYTVALPFALNFMFLWRCFHTANYMTCFNIMMTLQTCCNCLGVALRLQRRCITFVVTLLKCCNEDAFPLLLFFHYIDMMLVRRYFWRSHDITMILRWYSYGVSSTVLWCCYEVAMQLFWNYFNLTTKLLMPLVWRLFEVAITYFSITLIWWC